MRVVESMKPVQAARGEITGVFNYLGDMAETPLFCGDRPENNRFVYDPRVLPIHDMRRKSPSLEKEGFMLAHLPLAVRKDVDAATIERIYPPLLDAFLRELTGAPKIVMRKPMLRWSLQTPNRPDLINSQPANYVHADFSRESFYQMASDSLANDPERERWLSGRYAVVQTWRALSPAPQDFPLAVMDRRTIAAKDVIVAENIVGYGEQEQKFLNYTFRYSPEQRWSYVSDMTSDDVMVFVGFDNQDDTIPGIPHSSFDYEAVSGRKCHPRMSCELRGFVYWG